MDLLTALLLTFADSGAAAPAGARMTPELLWQLGRVTAAEPSPDGKEIVFEVTQYDLAANAGNADLWLLELEDRSVRRLTTHAKADRGARWSPDGRTIGFLSARSGKTQVYALPRAGGEPIALTAVEAGVDNFAWSPDGTRISYTADVKLDRELSDLHPDLPKAEARIIDDLLYRHWTEWSDASWSHLFVQPAAGGKAVDLMEGERVDTPLAPLGGADEIAWAPDGSELCYTAKKVADPEASTDSDLYVVPAGGGPAVNVTAGMHGFDRSPLYSPDGRYIAWKSMERAGFEADRERLMLYDRGSKQIRELTAGFDQWVQDVVWAPDSKSLWFTAPVRGTRQLFAAPLAGPIRPLTEGRHDLTAIRASADGAFVIGLLSTMERPNEVVRVPAAGGAPERLTGVNDAHFAGLLLPAVEPRVVRTKDGNDLFCWVILPPEFDRTRRYPLLTYCQGGPQSPITQSFSFRWNFHLMAARGYVVVAPCRRGMPGFGQAWNDAISGDWGGLAMQDYLDATDSMFGEPYVDRKRAGAVGASFGGYSVYWLMGHDQPEDRFACMVAHCGIFNLESFAGTTEELWFSNFDLGPPYWTSAEAARAYALNSPHRFVDRWDTPLLVIHGEKDFRVPLGEGLQAFQAAQLRGVPSRFLCFPSEGHWVSGPQNSVLWQRVFFDWLDRFLLPAK